MNDRAHHLLATPQGVRARHRFEAAAVGLRLAHAIAARENLLPALDCSTAAPSDGLAAALRFAAQTAAEHGLALVNQPSWQTEIIALREQAGPHHPLSRLAGAAESPAHGHLLADLALAACLPELHEGYASLFRQLHPQSQPYPTVALALAWLERESDDPAALRDTVESLLLDSPIALLGVLKLAGDGPWHSRLLRPGTGVCEALSGRPPRLVQAELLPGYQRVPGLETWLAQSEVQRAVGAISRGEPCLLALLGGTEAMRSTRIRALLGAAGAAAIRTLLPLEAPDIARQQALEVCCAAYAHATLPWLELGDASEAAPLQLPLAKLGWQAPVLASAVAERSLPLLDLPVLTLRVVPLAATARRDMWGTLLPDLAGRAGLLAARYPVEPDEALGIAEDLALRQRIEARPLDLDDVADSLRARVAWRSRPGVQRLQPKASWDALLVPPLAATQLEQAVRRVHQQIMVLDDWGFEQGRSGRRGLKLLFHGPPGTGKTLAAEAMAKALGIDLLVVDIASLVSKWIGETEKNLAAVFDLAEHARALLLFDEADALFGRRSEGGDAHDRYANLETAYLLQRLERFEGVAVLTTNLRANLDNAFTRRFDHIVEFPEPDTSTRELLWQLHLPTGAPLGADVDLRELADWYAISGAQIRNAALGGAFLAAAEAGAIQQRHFLAAIEREYEKAGHAHPGFPAGRH